MAATIITTEDLMEFKVELLEEFKNLMVEHTHPQPKNWLRSSDVLDRLEISHGTLQSLRNKNIIPSYKVEGILFYDAEEIDQIILENKVESIDGMV
ncbi:DNA-binding protein [Muricauda oceani]|uniref:Helix-turn-helix domain-containing protein n=1 Tax=Flagellimonas oceani TaxID=2698672 RepID=A0A6G7J6R1_9FLAO|nr:helix-turn-helix domain-containing protein [Allomuricauda oceani]MBW8242561.1 DNA-binding protein [Allomuricauda oceani]QII46319.1 helix-turn-helix domain-containing protein [Allomuricauda oceani]